MTYAFVQYLPGLTDTAYDRVVAELGDEPMDGLLVHLAGPCEGGWRVIQVWRCADDYARFERSRLWPAVERAGASSDVGPPEFEPLELEHVVVQGPATVTNR